MNNKVFKILEFDKIIDQLASFSISPMGKELCLKLKPSKNFTEVIAMQNETTDATNIALKKGNIPLGGIKDIREHVKRVSMQGNLSILELMQISSFLYVCGKVKNYYKNEHKDVQETSLDQYFDLVEALPSLESEINRCIISETDISDDASDELRTIRQNIKNSNVKIKDQLNSVIQSQTYKTMLQDPVITMRNDRYCVPVKMEYRHSFQGMVHDQSNTGSTLFIEPLSVVNLNNKIKELLVKEREEVDRILATLSSLVMGHSPQLLANSNALTHLDFIFAKASLSFELEATRPLFNQKKYINIVRGKHPLLNKDTVVPIDIHLGNKFNTLLITGPNTGGKTVAIKTLGLFTLMGQSGLHIPAFENSELSIFQNIYADIGDEQSIEQSLSTFSSHMTNIVKIIKNINSESLVLFDELGAGTDPTEGAALAMSIISYLHNKGVRSAITTHYSQLKVFAIKTKGIENASCEFSVETLKPTYRLLIGIPGKSNAFAISKRLGLEDHIIEQAKEFLTQDETLFEDVITDLEISKKSVVYEQERAEQFRIEAERLKKDFLKEKEKTKEQKQKILEKAREEAKAILRQAKDEADAVIKEIKDEAKAKNQAKINEAKNKLKGSISNLQNDINNKKPIKHKPPTTLKIGDQVYLTTFDQRGTCISVPDNNKDVQVQMGILKVKVNLKDLFLDSYVEKEKKPKTSHANVKRGKAQNIRSEIDCRGQLVDEALENITKYIDDAYLSGLHQITIIHGKGTGALRAAVQTFLKKNPHIKSFRYGAFGEGEMGVTVAELK